MGRSPLNVMILSYIILKHHIFFILSIHIRVYNQFSFIISFRTAFQTTASCVLIIEKDAVFQHLLDNNFHLLHNCILVTVLFHSFLFHSRFLKGKGYPDLKTLEVLNTISVDCPDLPFFIIVDSDPFGFDILLTYYNGPPV